MERPVVTPAQQNWLLFVLVLAGVGFLLFKYGRWAARLSEQLDAIGSTTGADEVEPATWKVLLYRGGGLVLAVWSSWEALRVLWTVLR